MLKAYSTSSSCLVENVDVAKYVKVVECDEVAQYDKVTKYNKVVVYDLVEKYDMVTKNDNMTEYDMVKLVHEKFNDGSHEQGWHEGFEEVL